jgi:prepilin-type processing-associated H-X9-DG protein
MSCSNNLKQIIVGLHNYYSARAVFPDGFTTPQDTPGGTINSTWTFPACFNASWSWSSYLLPFVEQDNLFKQMNVREYPRFGGTGPQDYQGPQSCLPPNVPNNASQTPLKLFRCPSDLGPDLNPIRNNHAMSNYRAVAGPYTYPFVTLNMDFGGVFYQNSHTRLGDITDGSSNTLGIGECKWDPNGGQTAAIWAGMEGWVAPGSSTGTVRISDSIWYVDQAAAQVNGTAPQAFSSYHPNGANFGFCDGSVRFFRNGTDPNLIRFLAGRSDGVIVNPDF